MTLQEHMNDPQAFEMALQRVRRRHEAEGRTGVTFGELSAEAQLELEKEHARLAAEAAQLHVERTD
jgi:hypothetical protein